MLVNGDVVELPGMRAVVTRAPSEPMSESFEMEITLAPGALGAPPHYHPALEEEYRVLAGSLEVLYGKQWRDLSAGEELVIPRRVRHTFRNAGETPARLMNAHRPADGFSAYWERLGDLSRSGKARSMRDPGTIIRLSILMMEHPDALVPTGFLGRVMMPAAAWLGRRLNLSPVPLGAEHPAPSGGDE